MFKKLLLAVSAIACIAGPSSAADWNAQIRQVILCSDTWFEVELVNKTMSYNGSQRPVRFMVRSNYVGAEKYKQMYALSMTAFAVQAPVYIGTLQSTITTSVGGGNCNANNAPAQDAIGMAVYR